MSISLSHIDFKLLAEQLLYNSRDPLLFNSSFFLYFFGLFFLIYSLFINKVNARISIVILFSLYFFYKACGYYVGLIILSAVVDFFISNSIYKARTSGVKRLLLIISIVLNLGMLSYFKYYNFFLENSNLLFNTNYTIISIALPVGISFYTFENISYTIDVYRGHFKPIKSFGDYLFFLSFFPKLMMGPIVRAADFIPQIRSKLSPTHFDLAFGLFYILTGCFKKIVISDFLRTNIVDFVFDDPSRYNGVYCLTATYAYALVIYCDFSGYSDMARGMAKWMGYDINVNFLAPYQSANITEFWRKWHISLSSWLRDYLYIPLGGNRKGKIQTYINLMITMILGGLWHGASWNFIIWGGLHGAALSIHKLYGQIPARLRFKRIEPVTKVFNIILTFHFVCLCWIFFACHSFQDSFTVIHQIVNNFQPESIYIFVSHYRYVLFGLCTGFFLHALPMHLNTFLINKIIQVPVWGKLAITITFLLLMAYLKMEKPVMPIYLQF